MTYLLGKQGNTAPMQKSLIYINVLQGQKMKRNCVLLGLILFSATALASDPVSWSLSPSGFAETPVGHSSHVTYTLTSHLPGAATIVTKSSYTGSGITVQDNCNNVRLNPSGTCTIIYTYTPVSSPQTATVQLTYGYNNNRISLPKLVAASSSTSGSINGAITANPATVTLTPALTSAIVATYTNTSSQPITGYAGNSGGTGLFNVSPFDSANITLTSNGCGTSATPIILQPAQSCQVKGTLTPQQVNTASVSGLFTFVINGQSSSSTPSTTVQITQGGAANVTGVITGLPASLTLTPLTSATITATYTNTGSGPVTGNAGDNTGANLFSLSSTGSGAGTVSMVTNFCGTPNSPVTLQPTQSCTVQAQITPTQVGPLAVTGLFTYNSGLTAQPTASTTVNQGTPGSCTVSGVAQLPLPATSYQFENNMIKFVFTNNCTPSEGSATLGTVDISVTGAAATMTKSAEYDTCSGATVPAQQSCSVLVSVIPTATTTTTGGMTVTASVTAGGVTSTATTSAPVNTNTNGHTVHFVNQCPFNVWYGISNAAGGVGSPDPTPGATSSTGAPSSSYYLAAQIDGMAPSTIDLAIPNGYVNGAIWPRTNCASGNNSFICGTGSCGTVSSSSGTCVSTGSFPQPQAPYTKLEFTIENSANADGVYDVSIIGGLNVPVEVKGLLASNPSSPFSCTSVGAVIQPEGYGLGNCSWDFDPSSSPGLNNNDFYFVTTGPNNNCNSPAGGALCGMAFGTYPNGAPINRTNGSFLGYWSLNVYQGFPATAQWGSSTYNLYNYYAMGTAMSTISPQKNYGTVSGSATNFGDMLICKPTSNNSLDTCYTNNPASTCCGCVTWNDTANSGECTVPNSDWTSTQNTPVTALHAISWLHAGCPTAYAYTFDDKSAGATTCNAANTYTSYQITFCPGGQTALPSGATEGRSS
ncbi:thaumatin family protein [Legionella cincinnatiensis]|uniref:Thaumatin domain-containing protein n=1 Tax=Legionella cincinnatiensis TaxID=28085 RepID=A0A378IN19_9GAMM|nr:thaumatin family protein [Legionella cincinnatiensis]KTC92232.1 Thaumatin domain-containing protein [Legionella cincinnatiensis]STX33464.1 Thaumatin domain-containing protein [Legionella cincinnatiensis]